MKTELQNLKNDPTKLAREEKEKLVLEANELGYVFGWYLRVYKGWMSYEDNMRWQYIGQNLNKEEEVI